MSMIFVQDALRDDEPFGVARPSSSHSKGRATPNVQAAVYAPNTSKVSILPNSVPRPGSKYSVAWHLIRIADCIDQDVENVLIHRRRTPRMRRIGQAKHLLRPDT